MAPSIHQTKSVLDGLVCFGFITSQVSSIWIANSNDNAKTRDDQTLLRAVGNSSTSTIEPSTELPPIDMDGPTPPPTRPTSGPFAEPEEGTTSEDEETQSPASTTPPTQLPTNTTCSPPSIGLDVFVKQGDDRFFLDLQRVDAVSKITGPPVFSDKHEFLCTADKMQFDREWSLCLPISGRKDEPFCVAADRRDLLVLQSPKTLCYASVLHMLLVEVYGMFDYMDANPALIYGTLLGAVRDHAIISFTEDVDIGYQLPSTDEQLLKIREKLWLRGYHMFRDNIWRVCISPTHPLARSHFDPDVRVPVQGYSVPYVDLYSMQKEYKGMWRLQEAIRGRRIPDNKMMPYSKVRVNGVEYNTVADPLDFLTAEYGANYMTAKRRSSSR